MTTLKLPRKEPIRGRQQLATSNAELEQSLIMSERFNSTE